MLENIYATSLANFEHYVNELRPVIRRQYDHCVNNDLSQQNWQNLLKRNTVEVLKQVYDHSLTQMQQLSPDLIKTRKVKKACQTSGQDNILKYFDGFMEEFIQYAIQKHRSSCALSNFPQEHNPSREYIADVLLEANHEWEHFVFQTRSIIEV